MQRNIICTICRQEKKYHAFDLCVSCYANYLYHKKTHGLNFKDYISLKKMYLEEIGDLKSFSAYRIQQFSERIRLKNEKIDSDINF